MTDRDKPSTGVPAAGSMDVPDEQFVGGPGLSHWQQSTITETSLDNRSNVFFAAIEMTRMPMVLSDPNQADNPIVFANNAFLDLTGYENDEVIGRNCRFLQGANSDDGSVFEMREAVAHERAVSLEILNYKRDGTPFWNAVFIGPVFDEAGKLLYFFASQLDVTRRRESEQGLRQAQKMESIGQLTAGLAHDFNNLLQVVSGSLEMLALKREDDRAFKRYHDAATTAAERGAKLTDQLLAFARRSRLEPKRVELSALIGSIAELLDSSAGSKADLQLNLRRRMADVLVDPIHFEMALINVVVNARDAMPDGGTITIATAPVQVTDDAPVRGIKVGSYISLEVSDEGKGMPPHVLARATEPFFSTKARGEGTGLGLAMAHGFAQQTGGVLQIDSEPDHGTRIRFLFPVAPSEEVEVPSAPTTVGFVAREVSHTAPPLVLIVEDNVEIATIAKETLADIGYRTLVAHDADSGLQMFKEAIATGRVDLVFSDVIMPGGKNGLALAQDIRGIAPDVPILLTTGYNDEMSIDGPQPEALDVLGKPYKRSELIDRVQAAIRRGARTGPTRQTSDFGVAIH